MTIKEQLPGLLMTAMGSAIDLASSAGFQREAGGALTGVGLGLILNSYFPKSPAVRFGLATGLILVGAAIEVHNLPWMGAVAEGTGLGIGLLMDAAYLAGGAVQNLSQLPKPTAEAKSPEAVIS